MWLTLSFLLSLPIVHWYLTRNFNFWKKRGISGPKPLPLLGNSLNSYFKPKPDLELDWFRKYGRIYGVYEKQKPVLTIGEPHLIKLILVKDFHVFTDRKDKDVKHPILKKRLFSVTGDDWKRLRSIISPTFSSAKMKKMYSMITFCLQHFISALEVSAQNKEEINLKDVYGNFTMDVISNCAFATKINSHEDQNHPFVVNAKKIFNFDSTRLFLVRVLPSPLLKLLGLYSVLDESANQFFFNLTRHILNERKANPNTSKQFNDFIQLLAEAEKDREDINDVNETDNVQDDQEVLEVERKTFAINVVNKQLSVEEIMAQGWAFFVGGYESTATTLAYCSYELALNPEIQERLYKEIESAVDEREGISYEGLAKLIFLDAVLSETLRKYPPLLRLERRAVAEYELDSIGLKLTKGQEVEIPVFAIHRSDEFYPNPNHFIPDRFMPQNRHNIIPYTYLPFGVGPRNCIGMRFALMEAKMGLAHIIRRFRFYRSERTAVPLRFQTVSRLTSAKEVIVGIEKR